MIHDLLIAEIAGVAFPLCPLQGHLPRKTGEAGLETAEAVLDISRTAQEKRHKTEIDRSSSRHSVAASFEEFAPCSCVAVA